MDTAQKEFQDGLKKYVAHLQETADIFNAWAVEKSLPVRMDPTNAIESVNKGVNLAQVASYWSRPDDTGVVHATQIKTAIECIEKLLNDSARCGHVVGAMQSGKTTTSLALQWAGPIVYLLNGLRPYPFYIIGSQTGHEDQTNTELETFVAYYGNVEFKVVEGHTENADITPMFKHSPSLATYRGHVLLGALEDVLDIPKLEDLVYRRVGGNQSLKKIADLCHRATDQGYRPLMIIDEPQFGASDRIQVTETEAVQRKCVLAQIFDRIEQEIGGNRDTHWFIGLSATPFEMNDVEKFWEVRQHLTEAYSGFNFFNGRPICEGVTTIPPTTLSLSDFATQIAVPFLANVVMSAYDLGKPGSFLRHARKLQYEGDQAQYRQEVESSLRDTIYAILEKYKDDPEWPVGLCIRAFNSNAKTELLLNAINLDPDRIEVIKYYGSDVTGMSVKRAVARRHRHDLPYVIFVTNRARMADAFPTQVRFFMDFALKASDLNSLLQGLLGRACGYNKKSTVVLSDDNAEIVDMYVATNGGYVHPTSRHSLPVGFRRGAPTGMLKLRDDIDDEAVREFFRQINAKVVEPNIVPGPALSATRAKGPNGVRRGPILLVAEELNLFDHLEESAVRSVVFPQFPTGFRVARRNDTVFHTQDKSVPLKYDVDSEGNCRFTFRWTNRQAAAQGGAAGRAKGAKDVGQHMEPTIYVEKYDPRTGEVIDDKDLANKAERKPGKFRAFMVTFPLINHVREVRAATVAFPTSQAVYNDWMNPEEQDARNAEERRRGRRHTATPNPNSHTATPDSSRDNATPST